MNDDLLRFLEHHPTSRHLQAPLPNYTSPPLADALAATPEAYRSDAFVDAARNASANQACSVDNNNLCQIVFAPAESSFDSKSPVGVIFYGGALVDPRGYSPLASRLATRYGLPVVIPIFAKDLAFTFGVCDTGRIELAQAEFEDVEKWILVGHSFGGIAAMADLWTALSANGTKTNLADKIGGLVLLASYVRQDVACGMVDYKNSSLPMASLIGSNDHIVNRTFWGESQNLLNDQETLLINIIGGTHKLFGSYNDSERKVLLNQTDGVATIDPVVQWDLSTAAIYNVASRTGQPLPKPIAGSASSPSSSSGGNSSPSSSALQTSCPFPSFVLTLFIVSWLLRRM